MPLDWWTRIGASWIGALASWWMGLVLAVSVYLVALLVKGDPAFVRAFLIAAVLVVSVTFLMGLGALAVAHMIFAPGNLPWWMDGWDVRDPIAFARAGQMHNFSYMGGLIGAVVGVVWVIWAA